MMTQMLLIYNLDNTYIIQFYQRFENVTEILTKLA